MKKWSQYLEENQKVLNEFNKKDEEAVMADEENFTVAFEIELESEGYDEDDMYEAEQEARRDAAENYFGYDAEDTFRRDVTENMTPEQVGMEEPDDGAEMIDWYYDNTSTNPSQLEIIMVALAYQYDSAAEEVFDEAIDKVLNEPMPFLKMVYGDSTRIGELQDLLGWTDQQMTMGFEVEGGKEFPEPIEKIGASRDAMLKIIDYFLINLRSLAGRGDPGNVFPKSKKPIEIEKFVNTFSEEDQQFFADQASEAMDNEVDDLKSRYGYEEIWSVLGSTDYSNPKYWTQKILKLYHDQLDEKAEEAIQNQYENFLDDPIQWLEDMGYEEDQWFDAYLWRDNYSGMGSGYGCDVYELERAMEDNFPNFMSKYQNTLKFEEDGSLTCGIEFSQDNPPYMIGLDAAIEYLEDFFDEYDNQSVLRMSPSTGLHTNIGYSKDGELMEEYNLFKALMFLNHTYATKGVGFPSRERSGWTGDLKKPALNNIEKFVDRLPDDSKHDDVLTKKSLMKKYLSRNFEELSGILTNQVYQQARQMGSKSIGFNVNYTRSRNYIEFRYPGKEDVNLESMTKALKYYAFIVKAAADSTFKQREYIKDLIGFLNNLKGEPESVANIKFTKEINKGDLILSHGSFGNNLKKILIYNVLQATELDGTTPGESEMIEEDLKRLHARRARSLVDLALNANGFEAATFLSSLTNNSLPCYYLGVRTGPSVLLDCLRFDDEQPLGVDFFKRKEPAKSFGRDLQDRNYTIGKKRDPEEVTAINKIVEIIKSSKNSVDFTIKFLDNAFTGSSAKESVKAMSLILRKQDGDSSGAAKAAKAAENEAMTDALVDMVTNDLMREDEELNEVRNHFKKWKF